MVDFDHLKALSIDQEQVVEYTLSDITVNDVHPILLVCPAGEVNKPYWNELLKIQAKKAPQINAGGVDGSDMVMEHRNADRLLFPKHVATGWVDGTMYDSDGNLVKFTKEACQDFINALPDDIFDRVRNFCLRMSNFREGGSIEVGRAQAKVKGKN